ncbi:hypothetical protein SUGI_0706210 [Cryptomeria japonica]|nr:hypothetical protein SUGI_0706210 [Cryptomeria japonica]
MNKFIQEKFSNERPIYNGEDHLYSPNELKTEDFSWILPKDIDRGKEYMVTFHGAPSSTRKFRRSESGHGTVDQELLQKLDVIVKEHPRRSFMGRDFYKLPAFGEKDTSYNPGITTAEGFSISLSGLRSRD